MNPKLQLHIPTPCHENWNAMTPQEQGRFCNACAKVVVDFSMMTDKEVLDYMANASSSVCGRMSTEQLAKPLQAYPAARGYGWKYMWSLLVGSFLMTARTYAQGKVITQKPKTTQLPPVMRMGAVAMVNQEKKTPSIRIKGQVIDEVGNPVAFASVVFNAVTNGIAADSNGRFIVSLPAYNGNYTIKISAVGFLSAEIEIGEGKGVKEVTTDKGQIILDFGQITLKTASMQEVICSSAAAQGKLVSVRLGGLYYTRVRTTKRIIKDTLQSVFINTQVKLYPNPVNRNSNFKIEFNIKEAGHYNIEFTDGSGKLIHRATVNLMYKNQLESFPGAIFSTAGVYYVSVTGKQNKKIPAAKILVQ